MTDKLSITSDFCVIGGGSGGLSFAAGAAQMGASVILIEHNKMGGDCLNAGCIPSKSLIAAARVKNDLETAAALGWQIDIAKADFKTVHAHIKRVIHKIAPYDSVARFESLGVKVILETGKFTDTRTVETDSHLIKAKKYIIATGSTAFIPPLNGIADVPYFTNDTIFDLQELPTHLVIIGGGPIGIELAQAFRRLGSKVTILEAFKVLPKDDPAFTRPLISILQHEGIEIIEGAKISRLHQNGPDIEIILDTTTLKASHLLVATGRRPNIQDLNLEAAKIIYTQGGIKVDHNLKTTNKRVYAIGDCTGGYQFTHVAGYHAGLAIRNSIFHLRTKVETRAIPWVTYTDPELAHVGCQESHLINAHIPYKALEARFDDIDRAQTELQTKGLIKVLVSPKGAILGATILGPHAGELIYPWVMAIQNKLKISAIVNTIAPYPTLSDIHKKVASLFYKDKIFSKTMRTFVKIIMWFTR